jgi:multiple sugar transport system permease protein
MTRELGLAIDPVLADACNPKTGGYATNPQAIMNSVVKSVNTMILGKMPASEVKRRSKIGWIIFAIMMAGIILGAWKVVQLSMRAQGKAADNEGFGVGGHPARRQLYAWIFLIPAVATIAIWAYYPLLRGLLMAFQNYKILGGSTYVGLRNFIEAVSEPKFWQYLLQTFEYMLMLVGIGFLAPVGLAILLTEIPKGKVLYRTIYYLPAVTTGLVTLFLWKGLMYDPSSNGVINNLILWMNAWPGWLAAAFRAGITVGLAAIIAALISQGAQSTNTKRERILAGAVGSAGACLLVLALGHTVAQAGMAEAIKGIAAPFAFKTQSFLQDQKLALFWLVIPVIWAGAGPGCLIYLAALKGIPEEQYEAADLDGAGFWQKILQVTYPNLKALLMINFLGAVIGGFKESSNIFVMTGGGPVNSSSTIVHQIYMRAYSEYKMGYASAMSVVLLIIIFVITMINIKFGKGKEQYFE